MGEYGPGFRVDLEAVHAFGKDLQHDLDVHLSAEKVQTLHIFSNTPMFGARTASPDLHQAAKDYHARLLELYDVMDALLHNGAVLARAAHAIADAYSAADIDAAINEATRAASAVSGAVDPRTGRSI